MRERKRDTLHAQLSRNGTRAPAQVQGGALPRQSPHFQFLPRHAVLDARAQRLGSRFLRREACRKTLRRPGSGAAIRNLIRSEDAFQKPLAESLDRMRNALYFHQIDAGPDEHVATLAQRPVFSPDGRLLR